MARFWIAEMVFALMIVVAGAEEKAASPAEPATYVASIGEEIKEYAIQGHYAYLAQDHTFRVVDISDKKHPKSVGTLRMDDMIWSVAVYKNAAYCGMMYSGFSVIDINDPLNPRKNSYVQNGMRRPFTGIKDGELWVYSLADNEWETYDISQPKAMTRVPWKYQPDALAGGQLIRSFVFPAGLPVAAGVPLEQGKPVVWISSTSPIRASPGCWGRSIILTRHGRSP